MSSRRSRNKFPPDLIPSRPNLDFEIRLWQQGFKHVGGVDEAGRGALAGPVAAAVVILPLDINLLDVLWGVRDSKQMKPNERLIWASQIRDLAIAYKVGFASSDEIDEIGITPAVYLAVQRAMDCLGVRPAHLLVDYMNLPDENIPQTALVKGDARALSIAAASVLAKTARDEIMRQIDREYPEYGFAVNKGYGTLAHRKKILAIGPCRVHRKSFKLHNRSIEFIADA